MWRKSRSLELLLFPQKRMFTARTQSHVFLLSYKSLISLLQSGFSSAHILLPYFHGVHMYGNYDMQHNSEVTKLPKTEKHETICVCLDLHPQRPLTTTVVLGFRACNPFLQVPALPFVCTNRATGI